MKTAIILAISWTLAACAVAQLVPEKANAFYCPELGLHSSEMLPHITECPGEHDREFDGL